MRTNIQIAVKKFLKLFLSSESITRLHLIFRSIWQLPRVIYCRIKTPFTWRKRIINLQKRTSPCVLHVGCGEDRFEQALNCEIRATSATDLIMDCGDLSRFSDKTFDCIYSHAFFEHLYRKQQQLILKEACRILTKDGYLLFAGIPYFTEIARLYLKSIEKKTNDFDIFNVYRYTHGDPEHAPDFWLAQLHKFIFDEHYLSNLLDLAGYERYAIFSYVYYNEEYSVNLLIKAAKTGSNIDLSLNSFDKEVLLANKISDFSTVRLLYQK